MKTLTRRAGAEDVDYLVHHRLAMFEEMGFRDPLALEGVKRASTEYFNKALRDGTYVAWLVEELDHRKVLAGGGIVIAPWPGFPGEHRAERAWILNMYTEPEARRQGIAKQLLEMITTWCRERGFSTVSLHASAAGRPLYESVGFRQTNEMRLQLR
jgi:GNAT superfamily N-acetyltransferase